MQLKIFKAGKIGNIGTNKFYYAFDLIKNRSEKELDTNMPIYCNVDFNVGNMHCTIAQIYYEGSNKYTHFVDEIVLKYNGADTYALRDAIEQKFYAHLGNIVVTVDASGKNRKTTGKSDVKVLEETFGTVRYRSSGNERLKKRQVLVNGLFNHGYLFINKDKCPVLWKDMKKVVQKKDFTKDGTNVDLTHASDTLDYLITHEYNLQGKDNFNSYKAM